MSKINNLDYAALNLSGDNYLQWALDTKINLKSKGLGEYIVEGNDENERNRYKTISIIRHHLAESLKDQYLTIENPMDLWNELKVRYDHHRTVLLPKANFDWRNLRFQDFKSVEEYNSAMFKIVSQLKLCGEKVTDHDMLEKTFSTFHTNNVLLQQQYRERGFETYSKLISCLLLAEQNNTLLMRNSETRPPGSAPLPEAHAATNETNEKEVNHVQKNFNNYGRGRGGRWQGRGRGNFHPYGRGRGFQNNSNRGRGRGRGFRNDYNRGNSSQPQNSTGKGVCHRCGMDNHWAKTCRTPKHLTDLYQESLKGKNPETHMMEHNDEGDFDHEKDDLMEYETSDILKETC